MTRGLDLTGQLAAFFAQHDPELPEEVRVAARHRILDTMSAMISGSTLKPGRLAIEYGRCSGGELEAQLVTTQALTSAHRAALVNGMLAHADETDDFDPVTKAHPGCSVVPAAWAMGERERVSGRDVVWAVVAGYEACCRVLRAMDAASLRRSHRSVEGIGATFGAAAAAGVVARLDEMGMRYVMSYAAQQASGVWCWVRDHEHVEKAFDFGGMGARNGIYAATMVQAGLTGVENVFEGEHNALDAFSVTARPTELVEDLGQRFFVTETAIKTYPVGYPIQSALDALLHLMREHRFAASEVDGVVAHLPTDGAGVVNDRAMPNINLQHLLAIGLLDGGVTFTSVHDVERMGDPAVLEVKSRVRLQPEDSMMDPSAPRQAAVEVTLRDGRTLRHHTLHPPGTRENPLGRVGLDAKVRDLVGSVLGPAKTEELIGAVHDLESVSDMRELRPLLHS